MRNFELFPARRAAGLLACCLATGVAQAELTPEWTALIPAGGSLSGGLTGFAVEASGVSYLTGTSGSSSNTDITTAAFDAEGTLLWQQTYNGPNDWHDQARGLTLGPGGLVWVTGNTPGPGSYANVLLLGYDAATGTLLHTTIYSTGFGLSEHGASVAADADGNLYVTGGTVGDGADVMTLKFDPTGQFLWKRTFDGPAFGPFSQDTGRQVLVDAQGDAIVRASVIWASNQPDFVALKYAPDGTQLWVANWGTNGGEAAFDMEIDAAGDVYMTGVAIQLTDKFSTLKLRGSDGQLLWQAYDQAGIDDAAFALTLDGLGGVYITGAVDPDGDQSNFNDNIYTVKRDAATGAQYWTALYGANCIGCLDVPSDIAVDSAGNVFVAGSTSSPPYGFGVVITFVFDAASGAELDRGTLTGVGTGILGLDAAENLYNGASVTNPNTGAVTFTEFAYASLVTSSTFFCSPKPSSAACTTLIGMYSTDVQPTSGAADFALIATQVQGFANGLLIGGVNGPAAVPFSGGTLCVNPPLKRGPVQNAGGSAPTACDGAFTTTVNDGQTIPFGLDAGAGNTGWYQWWYRDPQNGAGSLGTALSDAVALDFE